MARINEEDQFLKQNSLLNTNKIQSETKQRPQALQFGPIQRYNDSEIISVGAISFGIQRPSQMIVAPFDDPIRK